MVGANRKPLTVTTVAVADESRPVASKRACTPSRMLTEKPSVPNGMSTPLLSHKNVSLAGL